MAAIRKNEPRLIKREFFSTLYWDLSWDGCILMIKLCQFSNRQLKGLSKASYKGTELDLQVG